MIPEHIEILRLEIGKLEMGPTDTLIVHSPEPLTGEQVLRFRDIVRDVLGHSRVMVTSGDLELSVLSQEALCPQP